MTKSPKNKRLVVSPSLRSKFFPGRFRQAPASGDSTAASPTALVSPLALDGSSPPFSSDRSAAIGAPASLLDCLAVASPRPSVISRASHDPSVGRVELEDPNTALSARKNVEDTAVEILTRSPTTPKAPRDSPTDPTSKLLPNLPTPSIESTETSWLDGLNSGASSDADADSRITPLKDEQPLSPLGSPLHSRTRSRNIDTTLDSEGESGGSLGGGRAQHQVSGLRDLAKGQTSHPRGDPIRHQPSRRSEGSHSSKERTTDTDLPEYQGTEPTPPPVDAYRGYTLESAEQAPRKQSLATPRDYHHARGLLQNHHSRHNSAVQDPGVLSGFSMERVVVHRKIWVRRPGASATLVQINEDDLVDDVRDMILKKYANSLGRSFDSPDVTLKIVSREHSHSHRHVPAERVLGPEEHMTRTLDTYYPGGQTVDEALVIDVPMRRTPRHSPHMAIPYYSAIAEDMRPAETDQGYFPPIQPNNLPSPHLAGSVSGGSSHHHSMSVLNTGMVPPIPSPGSRTTRSGHRPRIARNNTSSPTGVGQITLPDNRLHSNPPNPPPLPTPPSSNPPPARTSTPPPRTQSPRPSKHKRPSKRNTRLGGAPTSQPGPLLDGSVPAINVLIVEDNIINLKLLEAFMKRLKVRWHTAMNGRDAVTKWKTGGFHLVLMDIQLPIMNGLEATKEIRRLERCNGVGVLAAADKESATEGTSDKDKLENLDLFKSSVIIVALTASSLQSDRHEALAAGCNDFLTKPVNFLWLERKVTEWGCMQALIDFDGWRQWKAPTPAPKAAPKKPEAKLKPSPSPSSQPTSPRLRAKSQFPPLPEVSSGGTVDSSNLNRGIGSVVDGAQSNPHSAVEGVSGFSVKPEVVVQSPTPPPSRSSATNPPDRDGTSAMTASTLSAADSATAAPFGLDGARSPNLPPAGTSVSGASRRPSPLQQTSSASSPPLDSLAPGTITADGATSADDSGSGGESSPSSSRNGIAGPTSPKVMSSREETRRAKRASLGLGDRAMLSGVREESGEWDVDVNEAPSESNGKIRGGKVGSEVDISA